MKFGSLLFVQFVVLNWVLVMFCIVLGVLIIAGLIEGANSGE